MLEVVCAIITDEEGRFLVCRRPEGKALAGKWEFPGGKVEHGEDCKAALKREIMEELACEIEIGRSLPPVEHHYSEYAVRLLPFMCTLSSCVPIALEHSELQWITPSKCRKLQWASADVPIWKALVCAEAKNQD